MALSILEEPWALGTDHSFLKRLVDYWSSEYNWREQEARLNRFPQYIENVDGFDIHFVHVTQNTPSMSKEELAYLDYVAEWSERDGAYSALHRTKPETLAFALSDSPTGLASWMVEKFRGWSDFKGDIESSFSLDHILTNISIYWFTNTIASSMRIYTEGGKMPLHFTEGQRITVPTGVSVFPKELPMPPQSWVERVYHVTYWEEADKGGHFAAMEQPKLLAEHLHRFIHSIN